MHFTWFIIICTNNLFLVVIQKCPIHFFFVSFSKPHIYFCLIKRITHGPQWKYNKMMFYISRSISPDTFPCTASIRLSLLYRKNKNKLTNLNALLFKQERLWSNEWARGQPAQMSWLEDQPKPVGGGDTQEEGCVI